MHFKNGMQMRKVGTEFVIVKLDRARVNLSTVISLNDTAAWIWENFQDREFTLDDVLHATQEHFRLGENQLQECLTDIKALFARFKETGLLENAT